MFVGRVVHELPALISRFVRRIAGARTSVRLASQLGAWGTLLAVVVIAGSMLGAAHRQVRLERQDLRHERARTVLIGRLSGVVRTLGGWSKINACGQPNIPIEYQSVFAWYAGIKTGVLYVSPGYLKAHPHPLVNIYPIAGAGWKVFPSHVDPARRHRLQADGPHLPVMGCGETCACGARPSSAGAWSQAPSSRR